jgi:hypothetical protein
MEISVFQLELIITETNQLAMIAIMTRTRRLRPYLKKSEAFKVYGRAKVENWLSAGLLTPRKDGDHSAAWRLDRIELETVSRALKIIQLLNI